MTPRPSAKDKTADPGAARSPIAPLLGLAAIIGAFCVPSGCAQRVEKTGPPPPSRVVSVQKVIQGKTIARPNEREIGYVELREQASERDPGSKVEFYYVYSKKSWAAQEIVGFILENGATYRASDSGSDGHSLIGNFELGRSLELLFEVEGPILLAAHTR
ncbi:MAG: hypothetical protein L0Z55_04750 [Planctomycetes bacterium]|nr:hypothetical protein [Planctomycetota bacterium]